MGKLVNLGSLCIDNVYAVRSIAGPGETVASRSHTLFPGGKGLNQSIAAARAGARVMHVGCIGEDGAWLRQTLADDGIDVEGVRTVDAASGHAVIQVNDQGENAIVIAGGANRVIAESDIDLALANVSTGDWLLLQNEINDLPLVLERAAGRGASVAFNVAPVDGREADYDLSQLKLLIVNEIEAAALANPSLNPSSRDEPRAMLDALRVRHPNTDVVLTLGKHGVHYVGGEGEAFVPAFSVTPVDETGAGDTFIGFLMAGLLAGDAIVESLHVASAAGALSVTRPGAASSIPTRAEVENLLAAQG